MKTKRVRVVLEMDIPVDETNIVSVVHGSDIFVKDVVWTSILLYLEQCHLRDATHWLAKSRENKKSTEWGIYKHHETWADIIEKAHKSVEVVEETKIC